MTATILLTTINARYMHTAFALRYLYANMGTLQADTHIIEFTLQEQATQIVEQLLSYQPKIIGFSVYIWNVTLLNTVSQLLKQLAPDVTLIAGGPEVSHPPDLPCLAQSVDYIITGPGELSFPELCQQVLQQAAPSEILLAGKPAPLEAITLPYQYYSDEDIRHRLIYVEASRGCPFQCEFCLSALDKTAKPFPLDAFLAAMQQLLDRGVRNFKFIDRTFNLKISTSIAILTFFLTRMRDDLYLHFEVVPDHLPSALKTVLAQFPPNHLQFEIGIQSFDTAIQQAISRKQNNEKTKANISWLREHTGAHLHTDLLFGLPQDTLENFAASFNQLVSLRPQEIQVGLLKRLRGAPINRYTGQEQMIYHPQAPYTLLASRTITFQAMQQMQRFSRFWDMFGNSGRFHHSLPLIMAEDPFRRFLSFSDALYTLAGRSWKIALKRQLELVYTLLVNHFHVDERLAHAAVIQDAKHSGIKGHLMINGVTSPPASKQGIANKRQQRHQRPVNNKDDNALNAG